MHFLPRYEDVQYNYSDIDFYIFDGTATMDKTAVTFALDLSFDNIDAYNEAKSSELESRTFMTDYSENNRYENAEFEFTTGDFSCKTVYDDDYPRRFELICFNDGTYTLRYLFFEEWEAWEYAQDKDYIINCTNCPWR